MKLHRYSYPRKKVSNSIRYL